MAKHEEKFQKWSESNEQLPIIENLEISKKNEEIEVDKVQKAQKR